MARFDARLVTPAEWVGIGAGVVVLGVSFLPWYRTPDLPAFGTITAWDMGFMAWFPVLLLAGAGVLILLPHLGTPVRDLVPIWFGLSAIAVTSLVLRWVSGPGPLNGAGIFGEVGAVGFGFFTALVAAMASGVAALGFRVFSRTT